jgi:hypothetical protein
VSSLASQLRIDRSRFTLDFVIQLTEISRRLDSVDLLLARCVESCVKQSRDARRRGHPEILRFASAGAGGADDAWKEM